MSVDKSEILFKDVLVVEDEVQLARTLSVALKHLKVPARFSSTLESARKEIAIRTPDLILLDRMLPDGDGLELCFEIRTTPCPSVPMILVLSALGEMLDRVEGLDRGADDYLPKPFSIDELHARIRALSRRFVARPVEIPIDTSTLAPSTSAFDKLWATNADQLKVLGPKGWVSVTQLEFKLLEKFLSQPGRVISRDDLLKDVWGFQWLPKTRTVDFFVSRVRKNFEINADDPQHFKTVRGVGYRFDP